MLELCNWISIIISSYICFLSIKQLLKKKRTILFILVIIFYIVQVLPLIIIQIYDFSIDYLTYYPNMYYALKDKKTGYVYCFFIVATMICLYTFAKIFWKKRPFVLSVDLKNNKLLDILLYIGMFMPLIAIAFAPDIKVYFNYAYFQTHSYSTYSEIYYYHRSFIRIAEYISVFAVVFQYYRKKSSIITNLLITISVILFTWIDGKRTLFTVVLLSIILIDWIKDKHKSNIKIIKKALFFSLLIILYFIFYDYMTSKSIRTGVDGFLQYELYYSRMSAVKTSIYSILNQDKILDYPGQSILYNLLFFIPREFWISKPVMFCKYFTAYVVGVSSYTEVGFNLQVNIWTEFIANFGIIGVIIAFLFILLIVKISENTKNQKIVILGLLFCTLYFVYGFENYTMIVFSIWIVGIVYTKLRRIKW